MKQEINQNKTGGNELNPMLGAVPLTIELVPRTSWYSNVRANVTRQEWDIIRRKCYKLANNKCEICGDTSRNQGKKYDLEAHEIWEYDDDTLTQRLTGIVGLCNYCHTVKHPGLANIQGRGNIVLSQLMKVNNLNKNEAKDMLSKAFAIFDKRSTKQWNLDVSFLHGYCT